MTLVVPEIKVSEVGLIAEKIPCAVREIKKVITGIRMRRGHFWRRIMAKIKRMKRATA